jgi:hypothetical protein
MAGASCFFTLSSEGLWYYLLRKPSCSRFHHLVYARTREAEAEVVASLARERPPVVLVENDNWSFRIDGVPIAVTNPVIVQYVLSHYRPWRRIGAHWMWTRGDRPIAEDGPPGPGNTAGR